MQSLDVRDYYMLCYIYYIQVLLVSDNARVLFEVIRVLLFGC